MLTWMHISKTVHARRAPHAVRAILSALLLTVACGGSGDGGGPAGPGGTTGDTQPTHPAGTMSSKVTVTGGLKSIAVSSTGVVYVVGQFESAVKRFTVDAPSTALAPINLGSQPTDVIFNKAGTRAFVSASGGNGWVLYTIDVAAGTVLTTTPLPYSPARIALSSDESRVFATSPASRVMSIPTNGGAVTSAQVTGTLVAIAVSPTSGSVYVSAVTGPTRRLDPASLAVQATSPSFGPVNGDLAVSPDGAILYTVADDGGLRLLDGTTLALGGGLDAGNGATGLAISPDGAQLYVSTYSGQLTIVDRVQKTIVKQLTLGGTPSRLAFDKQGKTAFVANENDWVDVIK